MTKLLAPETPQFRTALLRKLKNIAPGHGVQFMARKRVISFRLVDSHGRACTRAIDIHRNDGHALERDKLVNALRAAGLSI
jgi:hypothetical protein